MAGLFPFTQRSCGFSKNAVIVLAVSVWQALQFQQLFGQEGATPCCYVGGHALFPAPPRGWSDIRRRQEGLASLLSCGDKLLDPVNGGRNVGQPFWPLGLHPWNNGIVGLRNAVVNRKFNTKG
jgi:hypothetical protein